MPEGPSADRALAVTGTVQGVGFRPSVARLARRLGVCGWVRNDGAGVRLRATAAPDVLDRFVAALRAEAPPAARVERVEQSPWPAADPPPDGFTILASDLETPPLAAVTPDLALCDDCRRELADPTDRRHRYPFINCTNCGPRYSIIVALPYDRPRTTMASFALCPDCRREFEDPDDRRYHAQPLACPACGPQVEFTDCTGAVAARGAAAIEMAARALRDGRIVAVKGIGGYHLMVDATNEAAVAELRRRKHREEKPLAVMFRDLDALRACASVTPAEAELLATPAAPIVLVRRPPAASLAPSVAPANPWIGALLPYAPLHVLLLDRVVRPVVATSGNLSEEPLCTGDDEARNRLGAIADGFLAHDRPIARPVDDSVVRVALGGPVVLRRARGYAPAPLVLPSDACLHGTWLAVGAHLKNTIAVSTGGQVVLSPHIGELANPVSLAAFRRTTELLLGLYGGGCEGVACDQHPNYASTRFAEELGRPLVRVQHHLAHVLACLLEHGGGPGRVLGVAWDGTGHGPDGTVWGGEFILVDRTARTARRVARLCPFRLPGGEAAVREPRRTAYALLREALGADDPRVEAMALRLGFTPAALPVIDSMLERGLRSPVTSSAGRLFDGAAALLGLATHSTFEGQAAMRVEFAADGASDAGFPSGLLLNPQPGGGIELDWRPLVRELAATPPAEAPRAAAAFHRALAQGIAAVARAVGEPAVVLTGGCFQNARLLELAAAELAAGGHTVLRHRLLPPNDGSIAAGQALAAAWGLADVAPA